MRALETLNNDVTTENFTKKLPQIKEDLANYFEGLSLGTVEYILREFRDTTLKSRSILTIEKPRIF